MRRAYSDFLRHCVYKRIQSQDHFGAMHVLCKALRRLGHQPLTECHRVSLVDLVQECCADHSGELQTLGQNLLLREFESGDDCRRIRSDYKSRPMADVVRLRLPRDPDDAGRQGNLLVLKRANDSTGEKGVILLKYNKSYREFASIYDIAQLLPGYRLVLEPSYAGVFEDFFLFAGSDSEVIIECPFAHDFNLLDSFEFNMTPIRLGAGDWVDHRLFRPTDGINLEYDLVMVASWSPIKRHKALFRALANLKPRRFKVALIGYPLDRDLQYVKRLAKSSNVQDDISYFESISPEQVSDIVASAKASLFLSRFEGASKAVYESFFCDTPVIIFRHNVGFNRDDLCSQNGLWADDEELPDAIERLTDHYQDFSPRDWALQNTGYDVSTRRLNKLLKALAEQNGEPWSRNIVPKTNRPHLRYATDDAQAEMEPEYERLQGFLRTSPVPCSASTAHA